MYFFFSSALQCQYQAFFSLRFACASVVVPVEHFESTENPLMKFYMQFYCTWRFSIKEEPYDVRCLWVCVAFAAAGKWKYIKLRRSKTWLMNSVERWAQFFSFVACFFSSHYFVLEKIEGLWRMSFFEFSFFNLTQREKFERKKRSAATFFHGKKSCNFLTRKWKKKEKKKRDKNTRRNPC